MPTKRTGIFSAIQANLITQYRPDKHLFANNCFRLKWLKWQEILATKRPLCTNVVQRQTINLYYDLKLSLMIRLARHLLIE